MKEIWAKIQLWERNGRAKKINNKNSHDRTKKIERAIRDNYGMEPSTFYLTQYYNRVTAKEIAKIISDIAGVFYNPSSVTSRCTSLRNIYNLPVLKPEVSGVATMEKHRALIMDKGRGCCVECGKYYDLIFEEDGTSKSYCACPECAPNGVGYAITTHRPETRHGSRHGAAL